MPNRPNRSWIALLLLAVALAAAACGGAGSEPAQDLVDAQRDAGMLLAQVQPWLDEWREAGFNRLDSDVLVCVPPGEPLPPTPNPDPAGHTRGRIPCADAVAAVDRLLPKYRQMVERVRTMKVPQSANVREAYTSFLAARAGVLKWYEDVSAAWSKQDLAAITRLKQSYQELADLQGAALKAISELPATSRPNTK